MCALALASCSRTGSKAISTPHVLRFADVADPDRLSPYMSTMDLVYDLSSMIYSCLVISDDKGNLIGDLATGAPTLTNGGIPRDGKTYIYHLRHAVRWHDGAPRSHRRPAGEAGLAHQRPRATRAHLRPSRAAHLGHRAVHSTLRIAPPERALVGTAEFQGQSRQHALVQHMGMGYVAISPSHPKRRCQRGTAYARRRPAYGS